MKFIIWKNIAKKLDLSICNNTKIDIYYPAKIDENNLFKYNQSSEYYNDICFSNTTNSNADIIIKDRRNEFKKYNLSLCEKDCEYNGYNLTTKKSICKCNTKINFLFFSEISINKNMLLDKFINIKNTANIYVVKCYKVLFKKEGFKSNNGFYIQSSLIFLSIIFSNVFLFKEYRLFY